jgi:hypothetical protein
MNTTIISQFIPALRLGLPDEGGSGAGADIHSDSTTTIRGGELGLHRHAKGVLLILHG